MTLVTGIIGIAMLATFLGIMLWWVKALPLIIIIVFVFVLMLYDFVHARRRALSLEYSHCPACDHRKLSLGPPTLYEPRLSRHPRPRSAQE